MDVFKIDPVLASRAAEILAGFPGVHLHTGSGVEAELRNLDILYENAGITDIEPGWLDALAEGGRLLVPLAPTDGFGGMLRVERLPGDRFAASFVARVAFVPHGTRNEERGKKFAILFEPRTFDVVHSLHRGEARGDAWYQGNGCEPSSR